MYYFTQKGGVLVELNPDCVRDILLDVERIDCPRANYRYPADSKVVIERYSADVVAYHIQQCIYSGFFVNPKSYMRGSLYIQSLSPKGHEFISNIREDTVWNKTKTVASKIGFKSLDVLVQIASNVITELIKSSCGLSGPSNMNGVI